MNARQGDPMVTRDLPGNGGRWKLCHEGEYIDGKSWNDNAVASSHLPHEAIHRLSVRHIFRASALLLVCALPRGATAQSTTSLLPDATVLPRRALRLRLLTSWTRYDELLGAGGPPRNIASILSSDSLGVAQVPAFSPIQTAIQDASGLSSFRLTAGQSAAVANSRIVTAPLIAEFGLSSRLTLGLVLPLVETRTSLVASLNQQLGRANVGPNPAFGTHSDVLTRNTAFVQSVINAAAALQDRLSQCQGAPTSGSCPSLMSQQAAVQSLIQNSGAFAAAVARLYGTNSGTTPGQPLIPLDSSQSQLAISAKIQSLRNQYRAFLGTDPIAAAVSGAQGPAALAQLQSLLSALGRDTLQSTDRSSIGDITLGLSYQLANTYGDTTPAGMNGRHYRLAANASYRIGTGQPANRNRFFDIGTGYGQPGVEGGIAADLQLNSHWSGSAVGSYMLQLGSVAVNHIPNAANAAFPLAASMSGTYVAPDVMSLSVIPRYRVLGYFAIVGRYAIVHVGDDRYTIASGSPNASQTSTTFGGTGSTAQQVGIGFTYSTIVGSDRGPGRLPFEASFDHLETIAASGATPKAFRDQLELRLYLLR